MKIGEILELTQIEKLSIIAKERLEIGEKKASEALKKAGCTYTSGRRGWYLAEGTDEAVKEQSIYDFSSKGKAKATANVSTKETSNVSSKEVNKQTTKTNQRSNVHAKEEIKQANEQVAPTKERTNVVRKRSSFDLDVDLLKELKIQAVIQDKNVYEMVETAIRQYLAGVK